MTIMGISKSDSLSNERRWTTGSYLAAGFALFIFLYHVGLSLYSINMPTDGWTMSGSLNSDPPQVEFGKNFLGGQSGIQEEDQLLAINGLSIQQISEAGHDFYRQQPPNWPDGTLLTYTLQRGEDQTLIVEVPVRRVSLWQYFSYYYIAGINNYVQFAASVFLFLVSLVVFLLRPGSRAAHALLIMGATSFSGIVPGNMTAPTMFYPMPPASIPFDGWTLGILPSLMYLALVFPYPKSLVLKHPRLWVALVYFTWPIAFNTAYLLNLNDSKGYIKTAFALYPVEIAVTMIITVIAFVHTARKVHDPVGRSQFKWMLAGIFSFLFIGVGGWLVSSYIFPESMTSGNWLFTTIGWFLLPVCMAIGITRYRLFDIDVIIRKTLVYSLLSGLLGLVYFGGVTLMQAILTADGIGYNGGPLTAGGLPVSASSNPFVIVLTTLAIATLFNPLRKRIQEVIDRRFYRQKYDAEKALADFAAAARSETDLKQLSSRLTSTVQGTLQPGTVALWLKESEK